MTRSIPKKTQAYNPFQAKLDANSVIDRFNRIDNMQLGSKFKHSIDPINYAFEALEYVPLKQLAVDFFKEAFEDVVEYISRK